MSALLPSHDRPTDVAVAAIPAPRVAPPPEMVAPEPALLPARGRRPCGASWRGWPQEQWGRWPQP